MVKCWVPLDVELIGGNQHFLSVSFITGLAVRSQQKLASYNLSKCDEECASMCPHESDIVLDLL